MEKGTTEDEMVGWHHRLNGREFEQAPRVGDGQGSLVCYSPRGRKESHTTELKEKRGFPSGASGKESSCQQRRGKRCWFDPRVRKIPWNRKWYPIPIFLPGKVHGQRSLMGYNPSGHKALDTNEH